MDIATGDTDGRDAVRVHIGSPGAAVSDEEMQQAWDAAVDACSHYIRPGFTEDAPAGVVEFVKLAAHIWRVTDTGGDMQAIPGRDVVNQCIGHPQLGPQIRGAGWPICRHPEDCGVSAFDTGPLYTFRESIKSVIDDSLEDEVTTYASWTTGVAGPCVVLDGGGWKRTHNRGFVYTLRINVLRGDQSGNAVPACEELTRQVWDILDQAGYPIQLVPPSGTISMGDRDYPAIQMTVDFGFTPED